MYFYIYLNIIRSSGKHEPDKTTDAQKHLPCGKKDAKMTLAPSVPAAGGGHSPAFLIRPGTEDRDRRGMKDILYFAFFLLLVAYLSLQLQSLLGVLLLHA